MYHAHSTACEATRLQQSRRGDTTPRTAAPGNNGAAARAPVIADHGTTTLASRYKAVPTALHATHVWYGTQQSTPRLRSARWHHGNAASKCAHWSSGTCIAHGMVRTIATDICACAQPVQLKCPHCDTYKLASRPTKRASRVRTRTRQAVLRSAHRCSHNGAVFIRQIRAGIYSVSLHNP